MHLCIRAQVWHQFGLFGDRLVKEKVSSPFVPREGSFGCEKTEIKVFQTGEGVKCFSFTLSCLSTTCM